MLLSMDKFNEEIRSIVEQLIRIYSPLKVILFGSLARGNLGQGTDIDLFIIKEDIPVLGVDRIRQIQKLIRHKIATDFIIYKPDEVKQRLELGDPFVKSIFEQGKVIYSAE